MTPQEFEVRLVDWARRQPGLEALIQIGSRVQAGAEVDRWSDWDYYLIVRDPDRYRGSDWLHEIGPFWCAHAERTERGAVKMSVVFAGGVEADLVPLPAWQTKLVYWAMARPALRPFFPQKLIQGIHNMRLSVQPGNRVVLGGMKWENRLAALNTIWPVQGLTENAYQFHVTGFWRHTVWVQRKIMRGENRAALRWYQVELTKHRWAMLEEEGRLAGRLVRPEARKAEKWLDVRRLAQTAIEAGVDRRSLARALLAEMALFEEVCKSVATSRGWKTPDYSAVVTWLRHELNEVSGPAP
jgi:hypothetical protein